MPLQIDLGHPVIRCINYHGAEFMPRIAGEQDPEHPGRSKEPPKTTMVQVPGWWLVPQALDPSISLARFLPAGRPAPPGTAIGLSPPTGMPLQLFICTKCGYVEMYAGPVTNPTDWPAPIGEPIGG